MMLVDTSVWIDYFNGKESRHTEALDRAIIEGTVALGDLIFLEILQGFRNDEDYRKVKRILSTLDQYDLLGSTMVEKCADSYRALRKRGITVRKTTDVIIATFCIDQKLPLLFLDRDFVPFVKHLGLKAVI